VSSIPIGIVGFGKIAIDQHVPAIRRSDRFVLHSTADPAGGMDSVRHFPDIAAMLAADDAPAAVAICTPPQIRHAVARAALSAGKHVLLEKPPCTTLEEVEDLRALAAQQRRSLFCAWHSRFAPAVVPAREWLASRRLRTMRIEWHEDVRVWHPGQAWIWQAGGFGVFDPGINALSIASAIVASPLSLHDALLKVPANCTAPAVAELSMTDDGSADISASFDFLHSGPAQWSIAAEADAGHLRLWEGGGRLELDGQVVALEPRDEYTGVYRRFADLVARGASDADVAPLQIVTDALLRGRTSGMPALDASYGV
jgi:D-galactose 1-dehydrogenase